MENDDIDVFNKIEKRIKKKKLCKQVRNAPVYTYKQTSTHMHNIIQYDCIYTDMHKCISRINYKSIYRSMQCINEGVKQSSVEYKIQDNESTTTHTSTNGSTTTHTSTNGSTTHNSTLRTWYTEFNECDNKKKLSMLHALDDLFYNEYINSTTINSTMSRTHILQIMKKLDTFVNKYTPCVNKYTPNTIDNVLVFSDTKYFMKNINHKLSISQYIDITSPSFYIFIKNIEITRNIFYTIYNKILYSINTPLLVECLYIQETDYDIFRIKEYYKVYKVTECMYPLNMVLSNSTTSGTSSHVGSNSISNRIDKNNDFINRIDKNNALTNRIDKNNDLINRIDKNNDLINRIDSTSSGIDQSSHSSNDCNHSTTTHTSISTGNTFIRTENTLPTSTNIHTISNNSTTLPTSTNIHTNISAYKHIQYKKQVNKHKNVFVQAKVLYYINKYIDGYLLLQHTSSILKYKMLFHINKTECLKQLQNDLCTYKHYLLYISYMTTYQDMRVLYEKGIHMHTDVRLSYIRFIKERMFSMNDGSDKDDTKDTPDIEDTNNDQDSLEDNNNTTTYNDNQDNLKNNNTTTYNDNQDNLKDAIQDDHTNTYNNNTNTDNNNTNTYNTNTNTHNNNTNTYNNNTNTNTYNNNTYNNNHTINIKHITDIMEYNQHSLYELFIVHRKSLLPCYKLISKYKKKLVRKGLDYDLLEQEICYLENMDCKSTNKYYYLYYYKKIRKSNKDIVLDSYVETELKHKSNGDMLVILYVCNINITYIEMLYSIYNCRQGMYWCRTRHITCFKDRIEVTKKMFIFDQDY